MAGDPPPDDRGGLRPAHHPRADRRSLVPNVHGINEILAATQEVVPAQAGSKFPRRKLTPDDERTIRLLAGQNFTAEQIATELGVARKSVVAFLEKANVIDFSDALRRAAQRVPGPVAERSLAQARPF